MSKRYEIKAKSSANDELLASGDDKQKCLREIRRAIANIKGRDWTIEVSTINGGQVTVQQLQR